MYWSQANGCSALFPDLKCLQEVDQLTKLSAHHTWNMDEVKSHVWFVMLLNKQMLKMVSITSPYSHYSHHNNNKRDHAVQSKKLTKKNNKNWAIMRIKLLANMSQLALEVFHYKHLQWGEGVVSQIWTKGRGLCATLDITKVPLPNGVTTKYPTLLQS